MNQRDRQYAETHQLFHDVAFELFREKGYSATSMNQIATQAGFSRTALYLHFPNKPAIVLEHMRSMDERLRHVIFTLGPSDAYSREQVANWLLGLKTMWVEHSEEFLAIEQAVTEDQKVAREWLTIINTVASNFPGCEDDAFRLQFVSLFLGTDRVFYFLYGRSFQDNEALVIESLVEQWMGLLNP